MLTLSRPPAMTAPAAPPPARSLGLSIALHAILLSLALLLSGVFHLMSSPSVPPLEIEINSPFLGDGPGRLGAPKNFVPGKPAPIDTTADRALVSETPPKPEAKASEPLKDWVLPGNDTKPVELPKTVQVVSENGAGTQTTPGGELGKEGAAARLGGSEDGYPEGEIGGHGPPGVPLLAFPRLLNRDEVLANLRKLYPESERVAGREADVSVMIHIEVDGSVRSVDIKGSASPAFDTAAQKVARLMRFSPAIARNGQPVRVRLPQPIFFRLEN